MNSKYVYPNVFMSIEDTNKVSQYDTDIKKYAEQADIIIRGGVITYRPIVHYNVFRNYDLA